MTHWEFAADVATLITPTLAGRVDILHPESGLHDVQVAGRSVDATAKLLAVGVNEREPWTPAMPETYARGADLVATYPQTAERPYRMQAYWRALELPSATLPHVAACIELQISINTSLLDTSPVVEIGDDVGEAETCSPQALEGCVVIARPRNAAWSYVRIVHPVDRGSAVTTAAAMADAPLRVSLFGRYLEKGVILRARVRGAIVERNHDEAAAVALFRDFLHAPLPLTT